MKAKECDTGTYVMSRSKEMGVIVSNEVSDADYHWYSNPKRDEDIDDEMVRVQWTDHYRRGGAESIENINTLSFPPKELEAQWNKAVEKMNEAAVAIKEANKIMSKTDQSLKDLYNMGVEGVGELFNELDEAGWQTSTMSRDC